MDWVHHIQGVRAWRTNSALQRATPHCRHTAAAQHRLSTPTPEATTSPPTQPQYDSERSLWERHRQLPKRWQPQQPVSAEMSKHTASHLERVTHQQVSIRIQGRAQWPPWAQVGEGGLLQGILAASGWLLRVGWGGHPLCTPHVAKPAHGPSNCA